MKFSVQLNAEEFDVALEMMRRGGFTSPEQLTRSALYHYARHFDVACPTRLFPRERPARERRGRDAESVRGRKGSRRSPSGAEPGLALEAPGESTVLPVRSAESALAAVVVSAVPRR